MKQLPGSNYGEGIGGTVGVAADPNAPSYDPAAKLTGTDKRIVAMLSPAHVGSLTPWELQFLGNVYGSDRVTRSQHARVAVIAKRVLGTDASR